MRAAANRYSAGWKKSRLQPAASGFWLPAGTYTALRIELGSAQGHNWFCVLYPALCVGSSEARYADTEENALVFGGYQVRFALLDTACSVWQKITD